MYDLETIARAFFDFDGAFESSPLGSGNVNDTYTIRFERHGRLFSRVLQRLNHQVFRQPVLVMQNIARVTEYLAGHNFPYESPVPIRDLSGEYLYGDDGGNYWRCFPMVENSYAPEGSPDADVAYEAAKAYGAFARCLQDFPASNLAETIPGFHDTDRRWQVFLGTLENDPAGRVAGCGPEIDAMMEAKPLFDRISRLKQTIPLRVTHNDTKAGNVLLDRDTGRALAVIDLDTVMPGVILSDFGDMVRSFVPDQGEDSLGELQLKTDVLEALQRGFLSETETMLTPVEKDNLLAGGAWITGEQALRFLTDWLAGDTYYKIRYPEHNLVRARNQIQLFRKLMTL